MSDVDNKVKMIVEGLLLAAGRPLSLDNIISVFSEDEKPDRQELKAVMEAIAEDCDDRGFELKEVASGFRFQVKQELSEWVAKLWEERPPRYTRALLETLALIAYRQPITRGDIEEIRGVAVSANIIRTLLDREWVRVVGHRDVPGRPAMFATTKQFLDYFNLKSLQELPPLAEIKELEDAAQELDLQDDLANMRVIDLPEEVVDENSVELSEEEKAQLLAEEEAIELAKKPLDEILSLDPTLQNEESGDGDNGDGEAENDTENAEDSGDASADLVSDDGSEDAPDDVPRDEADTSDESFIETDQSEPDADEVFSDQADDSQHEPDAWDMASEPDQLPTDESKSETTADQESDQDQNPESDQESDAEPVSRFGSE